MPAATGVLLTSSLLEEPDATIAADRGRTTSAGAADLLVREQSIEARLTSLAANLDMSRLSGGILRQSERQLSRAALTALRGQDGSIVAGACITRIADKRTTVLLDAQAPGPESACATGTLLVRAAGAAVGEIQREHLRGADGSYRLLLATRLSDGTERDSAVLAAEVDIDGLFAGVRSASAVASRAMLVDLQTSWLVAGSSRSSENEAATASAPSTQELSIYVNGILSNHKATTDSLARAGWVTTVASLWPTITESRLGLIHVWPAPAAPTSTLLVMALVALAVAAFIGALAFMRHLIAPFHELEESQEQLTNLYREARQDSIHDGLTGMGNHRSFQEELARQVELFERDGVPSTLLLVDLDNLKVVNDQEGHAEGDRLIVGMADSMREAFRATDRLFRIGGDEFAVLLPDTEPEAAVEAADRLRHFGLRPPAGKPATPFSGGISAVPRYARDLNQLYRQADVALYWAKRHGRGFVEVFDADRDQLPGESG
ncbi:MAG: diguanylate cyclase, partial [Chloroflexota bacterium]